MANLFIVPARGGSKGIPGKNIKPLNGKPLIYYTLDVAKEVAEPNDIICVSTDDDLIIQTVEKYGIKVDFKRPADLASDTSGMNEVLVQALNFYENRGKKIERIILMQPTSPFRKGYQVKEALTLYSQEIDSIVSVKETKVNPYYLLTEENEEGFLEKSKTGNFVRRQDCPKVYEYNGAIYVINPLSLKNKGIARFEKIRKYLMDEESSVDLDNLMDWKFAEFILQSN